MNKGFDFWITRRVLVFDKRYWLLFFAFYLVALSLAIWKKSASIYFVIGFLPYIRIFLYKIIHDPFYKLKDSIENIDPKLFELILQQKSKLNINITGVSQRKQAAILYGGLLLLEKVDMDDRINTFIKNNKRINWSSMVSLSIWFFTFSILLFTLFITR